MASGADSSDGHIVIISSGKEQAVVAVWIDGDACPRAIKDVVFRAADRRAVQTTLIANHAMAVPRSPYIHRRQVSAGFDEADNAILAAIESGDIVITADVPFADEAIARGAEAINPRGVRYTAENIKDHRARRDLREELRAFGQVSGGPPPFGKNEVQQFSNIFDRLLTQALRR